MDVKQQNLSLVSTLKPSAILKHFANLSNIPRGSGNEEGVRMYILKHAQDLGLDVKRDRTGNIIVYKKSQNSSSNNTIILQDHMDMVTEKMPEIEHDFLVDPLQLEIDGEYLKAHGTTLGADNGVGMSMLLTLMEDKNASHPNLELLFTYDEEIGLKGALNIDPQDFLGKYLINIDTEEEGDVYLGCAGGQDILIEYRFEVVDLTDSSALKINVNGLQGGHSGADIHLDRFNSIKLIAEIVNELNFNQIEFNIAQINGGNKRNAIPRDCEAIIVLSNGDFNKAKGLVENKSEELLNHIKDSEKTASIKVEETECPPTAVDPQTSSKFIYLLNSIHAGIFEINHVVENLTETSNNLAIVRKEDSKFTITCSCRSMNNFKRNQIVSMFKSLIGLIDSERAKISFANIYPAWKPAEKNSLRDKFVEVYEQKFGNKPRVMAIHAGLETACFVESLPEVEMISFGPTIKNAHSPDEKVHLESIGRTYDLLLSLLKNL